MGIREKLWRRPANEVAISTKLLQPDTDVYFSELDLKGSQVLSFEFGISLGRMAANGKLVYDMHPGNIAFDGERCIALDFGRLSHVELTAASFLPWLSDMRATWGLAFGSLLGGFIQGLRICTATKAPSLADEVIASVGGRQINQPEWPLRTSFAEALSNVTAIQANAAPLYDLHSLQDVEMDEDEQTAVRMLGKVTGIEWQELSVKPVLVKVDLRQLTAIAGQVDLAGSERRCFWLFVFLLTELANKTDRECTFTNNLQILQAARLALQQAAPVCRYFESLLSFCTYRESEWLRLARERRDPDEVFICLGYCSSYAVTGVRMFLSSLELVKAGNASNVLWSSAWNALYRIRAFEGAFAEWAQQKQEYYERAAPGLQALARNQGFVITSIVSAIEYFVQQSITVPWAAIAEKEPPNIQTEVEWCRELIAITKDSPHDGGSLAKHFDRLPAVVNLPNTGFQRLSFVQRLE